jgi:hypothetical protein
MLERVRALLAKANGTPFEGEADVFRQKADELMTAYAIEQWQVEQAQASATGRPQPEKRDFDISWWRHNAGHNEAWRDIRTAMNDMWWDVSRHCRVVIVNEKIHYTSGVMYEPVIGLPADLDYFDLLFTSLYLEMSKKMAPKPDPDRLSYVENLVMLKDAGYSWKRIHELLVAAGVDTPHWKGNYARDYAAYCAEHNRPRNITNPKTYQRSFADGFVERVGSRLRTMHRASQENYDANHTAGSMELAVRDIRQVVQDAVWDMFPDLRPHPEDCECQQCKAKRKPVRYYTDNRKTDWAAYAAGTEAADEVRIEAANVGQRIGKRKELAR